MNKKGFTMVEILATITIIAIIATIAGVSYNGIKRSYNTNLCKQRKSMIEINIIKYAEENNLLGYLNESSITYYLGTNIGNIGAENPVLVKTSFFQFFEDLGNKIEEGVDNISKEIVSTYYEKVEGYSKEEAQTKANEVVDNIKQIPQATEETINEIIEKIEEKIEQDDTQEESKTNIEQSDAQEESETNAEEEQIPTTITKSIDELIKDYGFDADGLINPLTAQKFKGNVTIIKNSKGLIEASYTYDGDDECE